MNNLLIDDHPMVFSPMLANLIGLNESIVLQQVHYWVQKNNQKKQNFYDGYYWTYNSLKDWEAQFSFWSDSTVKRTFKNLRDKKLLIIGNYNKKSYDRTIWYRIDYKTLETLVTSHCVKMTQCIRSNWHDGEGQSDPMDDVKMTQPIPKTNSETNTEKNSRKQVYDESSNFFLLAKYFFEQVQKNNPNHKLPNLQNWANDIRLMIEIDKRNENEIRNLIRWVQEDDFEMVNVLSPAKMRKRFDQLMMKAFKEINSSIPHLDIRDKEIEFQKWVAAGNDPEEFNWS